MEPLTQALIDALQELIYLHEGDKGAAYTWVNFMRKNNAAIAAAKAAIVAAKGQA